MSGHADDKFHGGKPGSSSKAFAGIVSHYGLAKGVEVYNLLTVKNKAAGRGPSKP